MLFSAEIYYIYIYRKRVLNFSGINGTGLPFAKEWNDDLFR